MVRSEVGRRRTPTRPREGRSPETCLLACLALGVHFSALVWVLSFPLPHLDTGCFPSPKRVICDPTSYTVVGSIKNNWGWESTVLGLPFSRRTLPAPNYPATHSLPYVPGKGRLPSLGGLRETLSLSSGLPWLKCPRRKCNGGGGRECFLPWLLQKGCLALVKFWTFWD